MSTGLVFLALLSLTDAPRPPTYHRDIAPVLRRHCQECHRPGQVAPFSLLTYEQARKRAGDLLTVIEDRRMPPWHASTTVGGPFKDARVLSQDERALIASWVEADCPEGEPLPTPPPTETTSDWPLGPPDLVLTVPEPYELGAEGRDEFRVFVVPSGLTEGKWVSAIDFRPGNRKVVHHILSALDTSGRARSLDEDDPKSGYAVFGGFGMLPTAGLGGWAPGKAPRHLPEGVGRWVPAQSDVLIQVHYHKSGKVERDATSIGLYFAKQPIDKQLVPGAIFPPRQGLSLRPNLIIPAGEPRHEVRGSSTIREDVHLLAVVPHMHYLGKDFRMVARRPDGSEQVLIQVDDWNFNWQDTYEFVEPVALPKGTVIDMIAHFDNSAENPFNPAAPPVTVTWGEQTTNEMCIGFLQATYDHEHLDNQPPKRRPLPINGLGPGARFLRRIQP